jgi:hypothetical protein
MPKKNMRISTPYSLFICGLALVCMLGCKTSQPANGQQANQHFTVSLYSIGTGVDPETKNAVNHVITDYQKKGYEIIYTDTPWGREGERLYCFTLQKLDPTVYRSFFDEMSQVLAGKQAHVTPQGACE